MKLERAGELLRRTVYTAAYEIESLVADVIRAPMGSSVSMEDHSRQESFGLYNKTIIYDFDPVGRFRKRTVLPKAQASNKPS